jgi:photosystem II stability/assembly factor-like uncharacterized protein
VNDCIGTRSAAPRIRRALLKPALALIALFLLLILPSTALAAGGWQAQTSGTRQDLAGLAAFGTRLWAVGANGTIVASQNRGASWSPQSSGTAQGLHAVAFADATRGWAVGDAGTILGTVDGGATWTAQTSNVTQALFGVTCSGTDTAWAVGALGTIVATVNGGATWTPQTSNVMQDLSGVACDGKGTAWAVGAGGVIVATTDGSTWAPQTSHVVQDLRAVAFADATHGWAVGAGGTVVTTSSAGTSWTAQASHSTRSFAGVAFADAAHGWIAGAGGAVLHTANGGAAWAAQTSTTPRDLVGVAFTDAEHGGIAGPGGVILTTGDGGIIDTVAPHTTTKGLQAKSSTGWRNTGLTVTLLAQDSGSGPAATYYTIDGGARQTYSAPFPVSAAGSHAVKYSSVDWAGNAEAKHIGYVNIDLGRPTCVATANVKAYSGASATFIFRVNDPKPTSGAGVARITISKSGKAVKRFKIAPVTLNKKLSRAFKLTLKAGDYTWTVTATDLAGNTQVKAGSGRLKIVAMPLPTIADVQRRLIALKYLPSGAVSGTSDYRTSQALMAFQAWSGLSRDGVAGVATRKRLVTASAPRPRPESIIGHYVEVYRNLGVVLCADSGTLVRAIHCSTGRPGLQTTPGLWRVYLKSLRFYSQEYSSWMPYASFFHNGEGLHGYEEVPAYPASHGCVRLPMPEAPWVYSFAAMGTPVFVF